MVKVIYANTKKAKNESFSDVKSCYILKNVTGKIFKHLIIKIMFWVATEDFYF